MKKRIITIGVLLIIGGASALAVFASNQVRTNETLIYSVNTAVSTAQNAPFTLYIGDSLIGVTNPVKSLYFVVSGVYTGNGTVDLRIDSDIATLQSFTLPNVGAVPTPFEFIYKDPSNKISPTSAGSYDYTLNMTPSGVTIFGLGIKMSETHRYAPPSCADGDAANEKIKTTDALIYSVNTAVSTAQNATFTLYIGDSLIGVATPVKSLYFALSGVYTGNGTVDLRIDSDIATLQSFTLPNVGAVPTPFEFIYKDPSNKISPTSAGSYDYTLNMTPSGVTIFGLGIRMSETHRYKPPSCGGVPYGDLTSAVFDTAAIGGVAYNSIMWKGAEGTGKIKFQLATSNSLSGPWSYMGGATCLNADWYDTGTSPTGGADKPIEISCAGVNHNNQRYFRYKIRICMMSNCIDAVGTSPVVNDVVVNWAP